MTNRDERWTYVGESVTERARDRALSQADLVRASGVSAFTVRKIMRGEPGNYRPDRLAKIATALRWPADGIQRLLDGEEAVWLGVETAREAATEILDAEVARILDDMSHDRAETEDIVWATAQMNERRLTALEKHIGLLEKRLRALDTKFDEVLSLLRRDGEG